MLKQIGITNMIEVNIPEMETNVSAINVEAGAFFDESSRSGRMKVARGSFGNQSNRLLPAVDYIQAAARAHDDDAEARGSDASRRCLHRRVEFERRRPAAASGRRRCRCSAAS